MVMMMFYLVVIMLHILGATERMNLCQALTSAMDVAMEKDSATGDTVSSCVQSCDHASFLTDNITCFLFQTKSKILLKNYLNCSCINCKPWRDN